MTRLFHTCGAAVIYRVECDGLERFYRFLDPIWHAELVTCPGCGASLDRALVDGDLSEVAPS